MSLRRPVRVLSLLAAPEPDRGTFCDPRDLPVVIASLIAACTLLGLFLCGILSL